MSEIVRIDFHEIDQQWRVALRFADGSEVPGESFPAFGGERYSRLEQVTRRLDELGYRPKHIPYDRVHERRYTFEVTRRANGSDARTQR